MNFIQQVVNGLSLGAIYALIAIGFSLVYGVLGLVNFAHGDIYMGGTFIAYWLYVETGFPLVVALVPAIAGGAAASVAVERVASRPVRTAHRLVPMMTTFGVALILRNLPSSKTSMPHSTTSSAEAQAKPRP